METGKIEFAPDYESRKDDLRFTPIRKAPKIVDKEIEQAFHDLWTKAVGKPDYDKKEWQGFRSLLAARGIIV